MCDYTSEEIQEVYRKQREYYEGKQKAIIPCIYCEGAGAVEALQCNSCYGTGIGNQIFIQPNKA